MMFGNKVKIPKQNQNSKTKLKFRNKVKIPTTLIIFLSNLQLPVNDDIDVSGSETPEFILQLHLFKHDDSQEIRINENNFLKDRHEDRQTDIETDRPT